MRAMALEFSERLKAHPRLSRRLGLRAARRRGAHGLQRVARPAAAAVVDAITRTLGSLNRYPDPSNARLRRALSDRYGVPASRIAIGNGSCDILLAAGDALLEPGAELVHAWPSFSVYPHLEAASGARAVRVPLDADDRHDLDAMLAEITVATRLVIVCNPNNPTSTALALDAIADFVARVPRHVAVILDEAYCEFSTLDDPDASIDLLRDHANLVLLRTFSKVYGLCGLRVGFALCGDEGFVRAVDQVRQPFFCNAAAQAAAIEALRHQDAVDRPRRAGDRRPRRARGRPAPPGHRARRLAGQLRLVRPARPGDEEPREVEDRVVRGWPSAGARARRQRAGPRGRAARHLRDAVARTSASCASSATWSRRARQPPRRQHA